MDDLDLALEEAERSVGWVASYAFGVAWAGLDPADSRAEILDATGGDVSAIEAALTLLERLETVDEPARRRASQLLRHVLSDPAVVVLRPRGPAPKE